MKIRDFKHLNFIMAIAFCLFIFGPISTVVAAEGDDEPPVVEAVDQGELEEEPEEPAFQNPTQVLRAINLAEAYAEKPDPELEEALGNVKETEDELNKAKEDLAKLDTTAEDYNEKLAELKTKITELELELQNNQGVADSLLAKNGEVTPEDIAAMREEGMGWGQIAHELGLHPGLLGMGHTKRNNTGWGKGFNPDGEVSDTEIEEATARNFKSGFSKGHGISADKENKGNSSEKGNKGKSNSGNNNGNNGGKKK
jgi:hypothetical protein